jgi:hypothetical protein
MTDLLDTETGERVPSGATITVPVAIHAKLIGDNERLRRELAEARGALQELRIRLHAAGRRPEECYEMSVIDTALAADQPDAVVPLPPPYPPPRDVTGRTPPPPPPKARR